MTLDSDCPDSNPYAIIHELCDLGTSFPVSGQVGPIEGGHLESLLCKSLIPVL